MKTKFMDEFVPLSHVVPPLADFNVSSRERADISDFGPSLTRQEFAAECDINTLMERYEKSGVISHVNRAQPIYMDLTVIPDLRDALDLMRDATTSFMSLPAATRREFDNDPQKFVDYAQNPDNIERMREWGLAAPKPVAEPPVMVRVVPEPEAPTAGAAPPAGKPAKGS